MALRKITLAGFLIVNVVFASGKFKRCLIQLNTVTDRQHWVSGALPRLERAKSGLTPSEIDKILGHSEKPKEVLGRIYAYLSALDYDRSNDTVHPNLQEKRVAYARDIFQEVELAPWVVLEKRLSNGVHVFVGYSGHYMKVYPDGRLTKGNLHTDIHEITDDMLLSNKFDEEIFSLDYLY